mgnify:CR=1 FL=1
MQKHLQNNGVTLNTMIRVFKFRANDLNPSAGKQIEFNSAVVQSFFHFTKDKEEIVCHYIDSNGREGMTIKSSLSLSPARGDYKIYQNNDGTLNLKDFFLQRLHLTLENNSNDYFALRKREGYHYDLFYLPASLSVQEIYDRLSLKRNEVQFELFREPAIKDVKEQYRPFITAIKSKPFLLLAGISGTGKSRIVRELARACWDEGSAEFKAQKPKNFEMVQVKPNWHDSSELIGYVSRIDGVRYIIGPFLKFMVKAIQDPETPYFLCLDEMNLAPVEQYFAEYLSVIESRKRQEDGTITTDPIVDYSNTDEYKSLIDQLFPNDDNLRSQYLTKKGGKRLSIPTNLVVVGTVNMDETTFSFSRKVLDRAMTIEMNEVNLKGGLDHRHEMIGKLGKTELIGETVEGVDVYSDFQNVCDIAIDYLQGINDKLEGTPFKVAYRTRNEVLLYVVNNLPYNKDSKGNALSQDYVIARALDEITSMKILSRIEGDETKVSASFLDGLENTIKTGLVTVCSNLFEEGEGKKAYVSVSLAKLTEMKKRLTSGYTSFWS